MIAARLREDLEHCFCCCVGPDQGLWDDGLPVSAPVRVGVNILFYGKRKSAFPFHCLAGPDWPFSVVVLFLMISINAAVLYVISPIGWIPVMIGIIGAVSLLCAYMRTAFSDPGIIYKNDYPAPPEQRDLESSESLTTTQSPVTLSASMPGVPHTIECGQCALRRPYTARHCDYCKVCIDNLDHHCPWSGKCIGEKNMKPFMCFTSLLCFQMYYLLGAFVYFVIFLVVDGVPHGDRF